MDSLMENAREEVPITRGAPHLEETLRQFRAAQQAHARQPMPVPPEPTDTRLHQLVALFNLCDERGKRTLLAMASVQVRFAAGGL